MRWCKTRNRRFVSYSTPANFRQVLYLNLLSVCFPITKDDSTIFWCSSNGLSVVFIPGLCPALSHTRIIVDTKLLEYGIGSIRPAFEFDGANKVFHGDSNVSILTSTYEVGLTLWSPVEMFKRCRNSVVFHDDNV